MLQFGGREKRRLLPEFPTGRLLSLSFSLNLQSHLRQTVGGSSDLRIWQGQLGKANLSKYEIGYGCQFIQKFHGIIRIYRVSLSTSNTRYSVHRQVRLTYGSLRKQVRQVGAPKQGQVRYNCADPSDVTARSSSFQRRLKSAKANQGPHIQDLKRLNCKECSLF